MTERVLASGARAWRERAVACLTKPIDLAWLAAFRFCFGTVMAISMARFLAYGWIDNFFINPRFHFKYWGFGWVEPLSAPGMYAVFWGLLICATAMALGLFYRFTAALFVLGFGYVQLIDVTNYLNHYYLAWLLACLLLCSPAARCWSIDAWRRERAGGAPPQTSVASAWLVVFRVQVGVVYTYAGVAKAHADWLLDGQPLRIWLGSRTEMPILGPLFTVDGVPLLMSWCGFLFDSTVVVFLLWSRTRWLAYTCVLVFHTMTRSLFPIGMFSTIMVLAALVFFPSDWPRRMLHFWTRRLPAQEARRFAARLEHWRLEERRLEPSISTPAPQYSRATRLALVVGLCFCVWQVIMPLRFLAYGGNVRWHEQGMRFSWRVMVREKNGAVTFHVRDPRTDRTFTVAPRAYLTRLQEREMSGQPDLILQLAHRIRDDYSAELGVPVEVRVEALVSLNGRQSLPMVDPTVNLAAERDGLAPFHWVLPAPTSRPPHVKPV